MKTIRWQKCVCHGSIDESSPKNSKMLSPNNPVTPQMHVTGRYNDLDVHLRINAETKPGVFSATVMYFEPVLSPKPDDLFQDDEVFIDRDHICWLHEEH